MHIKPVMFLLALQLINAAPWALAEEQQVIVPIPFKDGQPPVQQPPLFNVIWEAGNMIQVSLNPAPGQVKTERATMPLTVGELLRVEPSMPIPGARASWLTFSKSQINLCAMKLASPEVVCRELDVPNLAATTITVEPRGPTGYFALRYRYRNNDQFSALLNTPLLVPMAHAMAQAISDASIELGQTLTQPATATISP